MTQKYRLLADRFEHKAGTIIFKCSNYDYGLARDDTRITGFEHKSYTLNEDGDYPFFTVPISIVEKVND